MMIKLSKKYNLLRKEYRKKLIATVILAIMFFLFGLPVTPIVFLTFTFNIISFPFNIVGFFIIYVFGFILLYIAIEFFNKNIPEIIGNERSFFILEREYRKLWKILKEKKKNLPVESGTKYNIKNEILNFEKKVNYIEDIPGFKKIKYFKKLKTMCSLLKDRLIPNLYMEKDLETISKIINLYSKFFLIPKVETVDSIIQFSERLTEIEIRKKSVISLESLLTSSKIFICYLSWLFLLLIIASFPTATVWYFFEIPILYIYGGLITILVGAGIISATIFIKKR